LRRWYLAPLYLGALYPAALYPAALYLAALYLAALYLAALYLAALYLAALYLAVGLDFSRAYNHADLRIPMPHLRKPLRKDRLWLVRAGVPLV
jgi:hypothetical protein